MDLSALRTLEYAIDMDVGTAESLGKRAHAGANGWTPRNRRPSQQNVYSPLAPMQVPIGANGLDSAAGTGVPAFCPGIVTFTAGLCTVPTSMSSPSRILQIQGLHRDPCLERSMFIPPKVSRVSENFGGINMDLSALRTLEYAIDMDVGTVPGCNSMPGTRAAAELSR